MIMLTLVATCLLLVGCGRPQRVAGVESESSIAKSAGLHAPSRGAPAQEEDPTRGGVAYGHPPPLHEYWPTEDGRYWVFMHERRIRTRDWAYPILHQTREQVPGAPRAREVAEWLYPPGGDARPFTGGVLFLSTSGILEYYESGGDAEMAESFLDFHYNRVPPLFIHGGTWHQSADSIAVRSSAGSWVFLTSNLKPGSGFSFRIALGGIVEAYVLRPSDRPVPRVHDERRDLEVAYVIDYGIQGQPGSPSGCGPTGFNPCGYYRDYSYGSVVYRPGVGPVRSAQYHGSQSGIELGRATEELRLELTATGSVHEAARAKRP